MIIEGCFPEPYADTSEVLRHPCRSRAVPDDVRSQHTSRQHAPRQHRPRRTGAAGQPSRPAAAYGGPYDCPARSSRPHARPRLCCRTRRRARRRGVLLRRRARIDAWCRASFVGRGPCHSADGVGSLDLSCVGGSDGRRARPRRARGDDRCGLLPHGHRGSGPQSWRWRVPRAVRRPAGIPDRSDLRDQRGVRRLRGRDRLCHRGRGVRLVLRVRRAAREGAAPGEPQASGDALVARGRGRALGPARGTGIERRRARRSSRRARLAAGRRGLRTVVRDASAPGGGMGESGPWGPGPGPLCLGR